MPSSPWSSWSSQASFTQLSRELGIPPKTVAKWRKRATVEDLKTGPQDPRSTVLSEAEEAAIVTFRRHMLLPPDECLHDPQSSIPHLTRSALLRCLQQRVIPNMLRHPVRHAAPQQEHPLVKADALRHNL